MKRPIEILDELGIIKYIEEKYGINYKKPKLEISEDEAPYHSNYSYSENKIIFFKKGIEEEIDTQLKFLGYKEKNERSIDELLKSLDYKKIIINRLNIEHFGMSSEFIENKIRFFKKSIEAIDRQLKSLGYKEIKDIGYLNRSYKSIFLYPFYINEKDIIEAIAKAIIRWVMFHEFWHSIDTSILDKLLEKNSTIITVPKGRNYYLFTILIDLYNIELRACAFEVVMYYLVNGFHKDEKGYIAAYSNIPRCRNYIEKIKILEKNIYIKPLVAYDLGLCYGNIIVAKYKSSLEENIYNIIDDIIYLDRKRAIDAIKRYVYNPDKLLHD
jgi:hypothetical protein